MKGECPPTRKERGTRLHTSLLKFFDKVTKKFRYTIGKEGHQREICEQGWQRVVGEIMTIMMIKMIRSNLLIQYFSGLITDQADARSTKQYNKVKQNIILGEAEVNHRKIINMSKSQPRMQKKLDHAVSWITYLSTVFAECGYDEKREGTRFLPYDTFKELFEEYENYYRFKNIGRFEKEDKVTACREVFRQAWISLKHIKLRTAKGAFETCCVCNNLNDCLKDSKKEWKVVR